MLNANQIFQKTLIFVWMKLGLGAITAAVYLILGLIFSGIIWLLKGTSVSGFVMIILLGAWLGITGAVKFFLMHYIGYIVKAGHVAVVAHALQTGEIPDNQFEFAKKVVKERFATANVYFVLDRLVDGAVKEIGHTIDGITNFLMLDKIPGFQQAKSLFKFYLNVALGYVDECCLGWTFTHADQSQFKSAADAVVIYFQNWKVLLKLAAKVVLIALAGIAIITVICAIPTIILLKIFNGGTFALGFLIFGLIAGKAVKDAFIDSWAMINMMTKFMEVAPQTELKFDLYEKLCTLSSKFKSLFEKGKEESQGAASSGEGVPPPSSGPAADASASPASN